MKNLATLSIFLLTALAIPLNAAQAGVNIQWENKDNYRDLDYYYGDNNGLFNMFSKDMSAYLNKVAERYLPEGYTLNLTVLDVDLAGEFEPWHRVPYDEVRIIKDIYPPRMKFTYTLTDKDGKVLKEGEESLVDLDFQFNASRRMVIDDQFFYEKEMMADWIRTKLGKFKA